MYTWTGVDRDLPQYIFGERHNLQYLQVNSGTDCSTKTFLCHGPPRASSPPGTHVMGESSLCPWPTGT